MSKTCPECGGDRRRLRPEYFNIPAKDMEAPDCFTCKGVGKVKEQGENVVLEESDIEEMKNSLHSRHSNHNSSLEESIDNYISENIEQEKQNEG